MVSISSRSYWHANNQWLKYTQRRETNGKEYLRAVNAWTIYMPSNVFVSVPYLINDKKVWNCTAICQGYLSILLNLYKHSLHSGWHNALTYIIIHLLNMYNVVSSMPSWGWLTVSWTASGSICLSSWASTPTCSLFSSLLGTAPVITPSLYWYL